MKERKNVMCYGERFPLYVRDSSPMPDDKQIWERVVQLAKIANQADRSNKQKQIMLDRLDKLVKALEEYFGAQEPRKSARPDQHGSAYRDKTPLQSRRGRVPADHRLSIPVENDEIPESCRRRIHDALQEFEAGRRCRESEAAYAARNPHKRG